LTNVASNVTPYPILMRVPYLPDTEEPVRAPTVKKPAPTPKTVNYRDPATPPPVRTPRREAAVAPQMETPITVGVGSENVSNTPVAKTPAPEKISEPCPPVASAPLSPATPAPRTPPAAPDTHGRLVVCCLLFVIAGLCVHWHWASLAPYCKSPQRVLDLMHAREATEMVIVPADGAPMLAEPIAAPTPTPVCQDDVKSEEQCGPKPVETAAVKPTPIDVVEETKAPETTTAKSVEETKPAETAVAPPTETAKPVGTVVRTTLPEPQRLPDAIVTETIAAKITIPLPPPPAETAAPKVAIGPIVPVSATILKPMLVTPANYWVPVEEPRVPEAPRMPEVLRTPEALRLPPAPPAVDVKIKAGPVEADVGVDILPVHEGSTP
jgi:hypothetical protein